MAEVTYPVQRVGLAPRRVAKQAPGGGPGTTVNFGVSGERYIR